MPERPAPTADQMRRYLLGGLSEEERAQVELAYLADEKAFVQGVAVEEELLEDYAEGRLSEPERQAFREHLLRSPSQRLSAELVEGLLRPPRARTADVWRWMPLAAGFVAAVLAVGLLRPGPGRDRAGSPTPTSATPPADGRIPGPTGGPPRAMSFPLSPGLVRGGGMTAELVVPRGTELVHLELDLAGVEGRSFAAALRTAEGRTVWSTAEVALSADGRRPRASAEVPASVLAPGDYVLVLQAQGRDLAEYFFRARRGR